MIINFPNILKAAMCSIALFLISTSYAQKETIGKAVYVEAGGAGLLSINYDMRVTNSQGGLGFRAGFGGWSLKNSKAVFVPLGLNWITSKNKKDYFEAGAGGTIVSNSNTSAERTSPFYKSFGWLNLGYRRQPAEGGLFWRATLVPIFGSGYFWPYWVGGSVGYTF